MEPILLLGGGGHAKVVADIVERQSRYRIAGITDTNRAPASRFLDYEVIGHQDALAELVAASGVRAGIVCIGDNYLREKLALHVRAQVPDFRFVTAVHPSAVIGRDVEIGEGSVVMPGCVVNVECRIGRFCILNTHSTLDHCSVMGDFSSLAPGATTGGDCILGRYSALALKATLLDRVSVGENVVIGAGSLVTRNTDDHVLMVGSPARVIRQRKPGEPFLAAFRE
jgi:sugar O-acyltransferase (sialic acid O-acetyltransferase NeuD family)